ncbi:FMN-binding protein [Streptomyces sp. NPDC001070]
MRTHPLRRTAVTAAATVSGIVLLPALKPHTPAVPLAVAPTRVSSSSSSSSAPSAAPSGPAAAGARTADGETAQTRYGPVQVRVTVQDGRLTAVTALQVPSDNPRDQQINGYAVPVLTQEALDAQSAGIDAVSGATYTSEGYITSLQSALDKAGL